MIKSLLNRYNEAAQMIENVNYLYLNHSWG